MTYYKGILCSNIRTEQRVMAFCNGGVVVHGPNGTPFPTSEYEHSSIPATVKKLFNLSSPFLTKRDAWAGTFEGIVQTRTEPRTDCPGKTSQPCLTSQDVFALLCANHCSCFFSYHLLNRATADSKSDQENRGQRRSQAYRIPAGATAACSCAKRRKYFDELPGKGGEGNDCQARERVHGGCSEALLRSRTLC